MPVPLEVRTERLLLRQWRQDDLEPLAAIYAQPAFLEHMPPRDRGQTGAQIQRFMWEWEEEGFSHWASGRGGVVARRRVLGPRARNRGRPRGARGVARASPRGAAADLDPTPANVRSRRVMEKLGLTHRGETHWHGYDVVWYAVERTNSAQLP